ncbi:MAG: hypothetical protein WCV59_03175 [Parcubacteria group bacterium]
MAKILDFPKKMASANSSDVDREETGKTPESSKEVTPIEIDWEHIKKRMFLDDIGA